MVITLSTDHSSASLCHNHTDADNHYGGTIAFGPDGMLWLGTGDGGGSNDQYRHAQDLRSPLGKLIRIDPKRSGPTAFSVPANNPYGTSVWARGLLYRPPNLTNVFVTDGYQMYDYLTLGTTRK